MTRSEKIIDLVDNFMIDVRGIAEGENLNVMEQSFLAVCIHRSSLENLKSVNEEAKNQVLKELDMIIDGMSSVVDRMEDIINESN